MISRQRILQAPVIGLALLPLGVAANDCGDPRWYEWLHGGWRSQTNTTEFLESWTASGPAGLSGHAETFDMANGEKTHQETMQIKRVDGVMNYVVTLPAEKRTVAFELAHCGEDSVSFENAQNDFPKRITYRRVDEARFTAKLSDLEDRGFDIHFERRDGDARVE